MFIEPHISGGRRGWIEVICGSMFSGKTEELIRRMKRAQWWRLGTSRYDEKTLSDNKFISTEIKSGEMMIFGILEARDGSIWFGTFDGAHRYDGKTITDFKSKEGQK